MPQSAHRATTSRAIRWGAVLVAMVAVAGCTQQTSGEQAGAEELSIVAVKPIDEKGTEITVAAGAAPVLPAGDGKAVCAPVSIAMAGPLTGPDAPFGANVRNGADLAVRQHNAANPGCQVTLTTFDTEGDPQKASGVAPRIVDDPSIVGLVGPTWSGETKSTGAVFDQAGLVAITPSATNVALSEQGWRTFFRGLSNDGVQGPSLAAYLTNTKGVKKACVVDDSTDAGIGQAAAVRQTLGPIADSACNISVKKGDKDFSAAVNQVKGASPDAVFYSGYYAEAAPFVQQLRNGGFTGTFASADGTKDPEFVKQAGNSAKDAVLSCPCGPATKAFADEYSKKFGQAPGTYSTEGYDLGTILVKGIDSGAVTREALLDFVKKYDGQGIARKYQWTDTGELTTTLIWIYKVQ